MNKSLIFFVIIFFALTGICAQERSLIVVQLPRELTESKSFHIQKINGVCQVGHAAFDRMATEENLLDMQPYFRSDPRFVQREREMNLDLFYRIWVPASKSTQHICQRFINELGASSAEVEIPILLSEHSPNDAVYWRQWYLKKTTSTQIDVNAQKAWDIQTGDPRVVVAIIDGSVDPFHDDLSPNLWHNPKEIPENGLDDDNNGYIDDEWGWNFRDNNNYPGSEGSNDSHGTHVAGIVAARTNNLTGIAGVAGGWGNQAGTSMMIFRAGYVDPADNRGYISHGYECLKYAADNGAAIAQCSWGGSSSSTVGRQAVAYFTRYGGGDVMTGGLVIAAAGNENTDRSSYPAAYPGVLSVAALDRYGERASFSNYGSWVSIGAPGVDIYSSTPNNTYGSKDGTSMACPVVSGIAALVLATTIELPKAKKTPEWLWLLLVESAHNDNQNSSIVGPRVDAFTALVTAKSLVVSNKKPSQSIQETLMVNRSGDVLNLSGVHEASWTITLVNTLGQSVLQTRFTGSQHSLNIEKLKSGAYIIRLTNSGGQQHIGRFVVQSLKNQ